VTGKKQGGGAPTHRISSKSLALKQTIHHLKFGIKKINNLPLPTNDYGLYFWYTDQLDKIQFSASCSSPGCLFIIFSSQTFHMLAEQARPPPTGQLAFKSTMARN